MGRIIANKVRGMNWKAKIALVLMFALVFSTFMHEGLLKPKKAEAAITYQSAGALAYSVAGGTTVAPAYPATPAAGDLFILIVGMKPGTANSGSVTTPTGWTPIVSLTGAGGYGATLGADTGNTNLFTYYTVATGTETGSLAVTINLNGATGIAWAQMYRVSNTTKVWDVAGATGSDVTGGNVSIAFGSNPGVTVNDLILGAMCIPTDVTTPAQFSAEAFTQTGVTFAAATEISEPDSALGNQVGGFVARTTVTAGTGTANPTMTATVGGTTTNVRGPSVFIRVREGKYPDTITSCAGCHNYAPTFADGTARNTSAGQFQGSHGPHVQDSLIACSTCHVTPATETSADFGHRRGTIQMLTGATGIRSGYYDKNKNAAYNAGVDDLFAISNSPIFGSCRTVYCHNPNTITASGKTSVNINPTPTWGTTYACDACHDNPPTGSTLWNHQGISAGVCSSCHGHNGAGATHANGTLDGTYSCTNCHSIAMGTRSAVVGEFGLAWGHKKTGRGAVADADCIVCHLEGVFATGQRSATYHQNGNVDLRDPDGAGETPITNISNGAFTFTKFATSYAAGSRTSTGHTSNTDIANVITQKFCLACHDSNGATNTTTRSGTSPTQYLPFGTGAQNNATYYTVGLSAGVAGGVVDVKTQFATSNLSRHPVLGSVNHGYPTPARLAQPYNNFTRAGGSTKTQGVVMNCFDCHNVPGSGANNITGLLTNRTIVAHGNNVTVRGSATIAAASTPSSSNAVTLCTQCHLGYDTNTTVDHGSGSAIGTTDALVRGEKPPFLRYGCNMCHSSGMSPERQRPIRGEDVHGFSGARAQSGSTNLTPATGGAWAAGRFSAFIRNATFLSDHRPQNIGGTTYTPQCDMAGANGDGAAVCDPRGAKTYKTTSDGGYY